MEMKHGFFFHTNNLTIISDAFVPRYDQKKNDVDKSGSGDNDLRRGRHRIVWSKIFTIIGPGGAGGEEEEAGKEKEVGRDEEE